MSEGTESAAALGRFRPYPEYKDSGVAWLGDIPADWGVKRLRFAVDFNPSKREVRGLPLDTSVSFVPMEAVGEYGGLVLDGTKPLESVSEGYTYFRDGDVVMAKITPCFENGKGAIAAGLANSIGFGTTELTVLRPRPETDARFLFYLTLSDPFRRLGASEMYGAGGQKRVPDDFIRNLDHPLPVRSAQRAIAEFLDRETGKIDALVAKKERLIELLQEKRTALITHAVTKGLDPTAPTKPSGIPWLGNIPAHWEVKCLKRATSRVVVGIAEAATHAYAEDGVPIIRSMNVRATGQLEGGILYIKEDFANQNRSKYLYSGDLVTVRTGYPGTTAVVPPELDRSQCFTLLISTPRKDQSPRFLSYFLNSSAARTYFDLEGWGTAQTNISVPILQEIPVALPGSTEQDEIMCHLEKVTKEIDTLLECVSDGLSYLKEFRTALISAAVTGKIDVREEVA